MTIALHERYVLPDHVRVCRTHVDTVVLDLKRNRYSCLGERETQALSAIGILTLNAREKSAAVVSTSDAYRIADTLVQAQILAYMPADAVEHASAPPVFNASLSSAGYQFNRQHPVRLHDGIRLLAAWAWARQALHIHSLHVVAKQIQHARQRAETDAADPARLIELVGVFRTLRPFLYRARERCLLHALTLIRFLISYGQHPYWVIGVRTRPWAAHSWVQLEGLVLDARPDDICEYTPILIA